MFTLTVKSIRANKARFLLTGLAVLLGVAFMAGTFVLTDTIKRSYGGVSANVYRGTDAVVRSSRSTASGDQGGPTTRGTVSAATLDAVRAVPGVQSAEAQQLGIAVVVGRDGRLLDAHPHPVDPARTRVAGDAGAQPDGHRRRTRTERRRRDRHRPRLSNDRSPARRR